MRHFHHQSKHNLLLLLYSVLFLIVMPGVLITPVAAQPAIGSFSPASGVVGSSVTITGTGFSTTAANNIVYFGAVKAVVSNATATALTVTVPSGSTYQPLSVTTNGLTAYSALPFVATFPGGSHSFASNAFTLLPTTYPLSNGITYGSKSGKAADMDGDGKPDILCIGENGLSVLRNTSSVGAISLGAQTIFPISNLVDIAINDFDGDGKLDIAAASTSGNLIIIRNTSTPGNLSFTTITSSATTVIPVSISSGDFDKDGKPDVLVSNGYTVSILKNNSTIGNIAFASKVDFNLGVIALNNKGYMSLADFNMDGKLDLAIGDTWAGVIYLFKNTSTSTAISFGPRSAPLQMTDGLMTLAAGDLDGDGKPDLVAACSSQYIPQHPVCTFRNTSTGDSITFGSAVYYGLYNNINDNIQVASISDLNGDGKPDIATGDWSFASVLGNISTDTARFSPNVYYYNFSSTDLSQAMITCDMDGDGKPDLVSISYVEIVVFKNQVVQSLPLSLLSFTAVTEPNGATHLQWQTANEVNTSRFVVEKSRDGNAFNTIGAVAAKGTDAGYDFIDTSMNTGISYYRLQIEDKDGSVAYSKVITIAAASNLSLVLYPNPVKDNVSLSIQAKENEPITIQVTDLQGKVLLQQAATLQKGNNAYHLSISLLAKGIYLLTVKGQSSSQQKQFIKE